MYRRIFCTVTACLLAVWVAFTTAVPVQAATRYEIGIATSGTLLWLSDQDLMGRLSNIKNLGATWIRVDFNWATIQPDNATDYKWAPYDRLLNEASAHGLKVLAVLSYTPKWARDPDCTSLAGSESAAQKCSPRSNEEFGRFAAAAARRYKHQPVRGWEIWNEPNLSAYLKTVESGKIVLTSPARYAGIANTVATQLRKYDPDSVVVTGGLAPMFEPKYPKNMRQSDYLAQLLPHLNKDLFDGVSIHPYSWPVLPEKAAVYNAFYTVDSGKPGYNLREVMKAANWEDKEIWGTEFGASTKGIQSASNPIKGVRPDHVTEDAQAQILHQGIDAWYTKENVGPLFVHSDTDQWLTSRKNEGGFGLRRSDGSEKPAYRVFKEGAQQLTQH